MSVHKRPPVAIVGMATLFPQSPDLETYWRNILAGRDCITGVPEGHSWSPDDYFDPDPAAPDKTWCTRGGFLEKVPFDPLQYGIPPAMLESIDTTQLLSLIVAREALKDAGLDPDGAGWDRERVSVILGVTGTQEMAITAGARLQGPIWRKSLLRCGVDPALAEVIVRDIANHFPTWTEQTFPGLLGNVVSGRIANRLDLGGTNAVVDAACASSLAALQYAVGELISGSSDLVLTGGADTLNDIFMFECFTRTPAFTRKGDARPFDAEADGILIGEGIAICALKRLQDAERDGDRIYAVLRGIGSSSDGKYKSIYAPNPTGQAKALRRAYQQAGFGPETVELVEAHGTGTRAGDTAEVEALTKVYRESGREGRWVALGSVKSQIGHTKSTAGAAGLVKAALALHQRVLPPTAKIEAPNPKMAFEASPFYLSPRARPWIRAADHPRRAAVSAFGFGGSNFHAVLEEYGDSTSVAAVSPAAAELFLLSADSAEALAERLQALASSEPPTVSHASRETLRSFQPGAPHVVSFLASSLDELSQRVDTALQRLRGAPARPRDEVWVGGGQPLPTAWLFPGQGSQYLEMGRTLALRHAPVRRALDLADESFRSAGLPALSSRMFPPPAWSEDERQAQAEALRATEWAQPAIGALSAGMASLLQRFGLKPQAVAGHSYGELVALHVAGVFDEDGLSRASRERGRAMATGHGSMAAVDAAPEQLSELAERHQLVLANHNHPSQVVLSGPAEAIREAVAELVARGVSARELPVSAAFHSPLVAGARAPFREALSEIALRAPALPVIGCADAAPYPSEPEAIRERLADQLLRPVQWVDTVEALWHSGIRTFVEVGPKGVLSGLVEKCLAGRGATVLGLDRLADKEDGDTQLKRALAWLASLGHPVNPAPLLAERCPPGPRKAGPASVWLAGANHRNPETLEPPMPSLPRPPAPPASAVPDGADALGWAAVPSSGRPMEKPVHLDVSEQVSAAQPAALAPVALPGQPTPVPQPTSELLALLDSTRATLAAFQEAQARTAEVHARFLDGVARANDNFARLFEAQTRLVEQVASGGVISAPAPRSLPVQPLPAQPLPAQPALAPQALVAPSPVAAPAPAVAAAPAAAPAPRTAPLDLGPVVLPTTARPAVATDLPPLFDARAAVEARSSAPVPSRPEAGPARRQGASLQEALLGVVADKTGYPRESLELSMDLESDLGIDSIKRVEILSAVRERMPELPELADEKLSALRTLADVVGALDGGAPSLPVPEILQTKAPPSREALVNTLLDAVATKTGFPRESLELSMDLESDLGIDSIKRVEILSAVRERMPELPEVADDALAGLRRLSDIAEHMGGVALGLGFALIGSQSRSTAAPALLVPPAAEPAPEKIAPAPGLPPVQSASDLLTTAPDSPATVPVSLRRRPVSLIPAPAHRSARPALAGRWVLTADPGSVLARGLAQALARRGLEPVVLDPDWSADTLEVPADCVGAVHLAAVGATGPDAWRRVRGAFLLAKALAPATCRRFVTISQRGGRFGRSSAVGEPVTGALAGLTKTLGHEWPELSPLALDLGPEPDLEAVAEEILGDRGVVEVGLATDGAWTLAASPELGAPSGALPLQPGDLAVVTGGGRGVTAACVLALARELPLSFLLLGRSALEDEPGWALGVADAELVARRLSLPGPRPSPREAEAEAARIRASREVKATLAALQAAGSQATYRAVDSRDAEAVRGAVAEAVARQGPVRMIVHGAGVLADKRVLDKTPVQFDLVFGTKLQGFRSLLGAVDEAQLRVAMAFTSIAGRTGNPGQCDYAMANEALVHELLALRQRQPGLTARALDWGPWDGGMVTPSLRAHFTARGHGILPLPLGARAFVDELGREGDEVVLEGARPPVGQLVQVLPARAPWLWDHRIDGRPVLPAAVVAQWAAELASEVAPHLQLAAVRDLKVLKGVVLEGEQARVQLSWKARPAGRGLHLELEVLGEKEPGSFSLPHYRAVVELAEAAPALKSAVSPEDLALEPWAGSVYDHLFHGPGFQAIERVVGLSERGGTAELRCGAPSALGVAATRWAIDPVAIDAALQLMVTWVREKRGSGALPSALGAVRWEGALGVPGERLRVALAVEGTARAGTYAASFFAPDGTLVGVLEGGEYTATPSLISTLAPLSPPAAP